MAHLGTSPTRLAVTAVGPPDPRTAVQRLRRSFFDLHLRHRDDHLLDKPTPRYLEILFVG